jgi:hypothetical protein
MSAALSTPLAICKAGQLRTLNKVQSTSFAAVRPSIFRNTLSQRDSFATFSLGGGELPRPITLPLSLARRSISHFNILLP